ncbi:MAG: di-trans,poly-cis-decaprenylcistransferase, partial [Opitutales bacterium]|nr:di-trans,poly-cis-decaprenylcistransferase [Opitutales bacterium]
PRLEIKALMGLLLASLEKYEGEFLKNEIRFETIGDISALPKSCVKAINALKQKTRSFSRTTLVLALNYGSRAELVRAVRKIEKPASEVEWGDIASALDTAEIPDPDLLIRTSGEMRLSNYLLLQAAYAELYFTKVYWPDFGAEDFRAALKEYAKRERRYGLTTEQIKKDDKKNR